MIIRNEQMAAFQEAADRDFENRAIQYLQENFPRRCETVGPENLHPIVQIGRKCAAHYQCFGEQGIVVYLHLMFILGSGFDSDPQLPWAAEILNDAEKHEITRTESLWQKAHEYAFLVNGEENEYLNRAILKIKEYPLSTPSNKLDANFDEQVLQLLKSLYPEKYDALDEAALDALIQAATEKAAQYGITGKLGSRMMVVLMFIFGGGFDDDPLLPWAAEILRDETLKDSNQKVSLLYEEASKNLKLDSPAKVN